MMYGSDLEKNGHWPVYYVRTRMQQLYIYIYMWYKVSRMILNKLVYYSV